MTLIGLAQNLYKLQHAVRTGEIEEILSDSDLEAARDAFRKVSLANDRTAQIWSAVNHLESAHSKIRSAYYKKKSYVLGKAMFLDRMQKKDRYVLCVLSICYYFLGEKKLCIQSLQLAQDVKEEMYGHGIWQEIIDPRLWRECAIDVFGNKECYFTKEQAIEFSKILSPHL